MLSIIFRLTRHQKLCCRSPTQGLGIRDFNHGVIGRSRNFGVSLARAPFIAFLDSDDTWAPEKLESCISVLNNESADVVCHSETWKGPNYQQRLVHYGPTNRSTFKNLVLRGNCLSTSATLMSKKKFLDVAGFREDLQINTAEDYDLWIRLAQAGANFAFLRKTSEYGGSMRQEAVGP